MKKLITHSKSEYQTLVQQISETYQIGQANAYRSVNRELLETNWKIGQYIVEFEQGGNTKAEYGKALLDNLSKDLTLLHGKGFSRSNLNHIRQLYLIHPTCETVSHKLSWSHHPTWHYHAALHLQIPALPAERGRISDGIGVYFGAGGRELMKF